MTTNGARTVFHGVLRLVLFHLAAILALSVGSLWMHDGSRATTSELKEAISDHYDLLSPYYKQVWGVHLHHGIWRTGKETDAEATQNLVNELDGRCGLRDGMKVLDVGCGYGGASVYHAYNRSCHVTGITVSQTQVEMSQQSAKEVGVAERTRFVKMDAEKMAFPGEDGTFDMVWTTEVLNHLHDRGSFFLHSERLLKPGGTICLMDWFKQPGLSDEEEKKRIRPIEYGMLNPSLGTMPQYEKLALDNGFTVIYNEDIS